VLEGARRLLDEKPPFLTIGLHHPTTRHGGSGLKNAITWLLAIA